MHETIKRYRVAEAAFQQARGALEEAVGGIAADRLAASDDACSVDIEIVEQISDTRGFDEDPRYGMYSSARKPLPVTDRRVYRQGPRRRRQTEGRARFSEDEQHERELRRRHPESNIWRKLEAGEPA